MNENHDVAVCACVDHTSLSVFVVQCHARGHSYVYITHLDQRNGAGLKQSHSLGAGVVRPALIRDVARLVGTWWRYQRSGRSATDPAMLSRLDSSWSPFQIDPAEAEEHLPMAGQYDLPFDD